MQLVDFLVWPRFSSFGFGRSVDSYPERRRGHRSDSYSDTTDEGDERPRRRQVFTRRRINRKKLEEVLKYKYGRNYRLEVSSRIPAVLASGFVRTYGLPPGLLFL